MKAEERDPVGYGSDIQEGSHSRPSSASVEGPSRVARFLQLAGGRRRPTVLALFLLGTTAACGTESTQSLTSPVAVAAVGPEVVASRIDLTRIAEVASDPFVTEVLGVLPSEKASFASGAVHEFGAKVLAAPAESFYGLETALFEIDGDQDLVEDAEESDADIAYGVLGVYRGWAHLTLFGTEPGTPGPSPR